MYFNALSQRVPAVGSLCSQEPQGPPVDASLAALKAFHDLYDPEGESNPWGENGIEMLEAWQHFGRGYLAAKGWRLVDDKVLGSWWANVLE